MFSPRSAALRSPDADRGLQPSGNAGSARSPTPIPRRRSDRRLDPDHRRARLPKQLDHRAEVSSLESLRGVAIDEPGGIGDSVKLRVLQADDIAAWAVQAGGQYARRAPTREAHDARQAQGGGLAHAEQGGRPPRRPAP